MIALDITRDSNILDKFNNQIITISALLLLLFLVLEIVMIKFGLQPLKLFIKKIREITPSTLEPLVLKNTPSDLELLLIEINQLIQRTKLSHDSLLSFSSNVAHELRTPINNLMISNEILLMQKNLSPEITKYILSNMEEYQRLANLIDKLLFIARLGETDKKLNLEYISLNEEISKVVEFHEASAEEKNISVILKNINGKVYADKDLFHHTISNVLSNAIKYSPDNACITISTLHNTNKVAIFIADTGYGIPHSEVSKISKRFYRSNHNIDSTKPGFGLGLSIVQSIMNTLNGEMKIEPNKPSGLIVNLIFPLFNS